MAKTYLDNLVEYPAKVLHKIGSDQRVVSLLLDSPNVDINGEAADSVYDKYLFDYGYVDGTTEETRAYICTEAEMIKSPTPSIHDLRIYVTIICHKQFMKVDAGKFRGMIGNRRDNLTRFIDGILNGSDIFGIGVLTLDSAKTVASPTGFTARELTYRISDFKDKGVVRG